MTFDIFYLNYMGLTRTKYNIMVVKEFPPPHCSSTIIILKKLPSSYVIPQRQIIPLYWGDIVTNSLESLLKKTFPHPLQYPFPLYKDTLPLCPPSPNFILSNRTSNLLLFKQTIVSYVHISILTIHNPLHSWSFPFGL